MVSEIKRLIKARPLVYTIARRIVDALAGLAYLGQVSKVPAEIENLLLGSNCKLPDWVTFDICPGADFLGNITSLRLFADRSVGRIYASHVLEHITYRQAPQAVDEMYRVLKPGGRLFLVVPDLLSVSQLLNTPQAEVAVDIIYGINKQAGLGQPGHKYGYSKQMLSDLLTGAGFENIEEFEPFIDDTSNYYVSHVKVSLCLQAVKPVSV